MCKWSVREYSWSNTSGREGKGREGKGREEKGKKGTEGKGREMKERVGKGREQDRIYGKLSCHRVSMETSGNPAKRFEAGIPLREIPSRARGLGL